MAAHAHRIADHSPEPPPQPTRKWYVDEIVVAAFAILGVGGAVLLPLRYGFTPSGGKIPPALVSYLLATGLAALTYRYLGGIEGASFKVGALKLGGALAALVGIATLVNTQLLPQVQPPPTAQVWELDGQITDDQGTVIQQLVPTDFKLSPPDTRVDPGGNFKLNFYTEPTLVGTGMDFPSLTIGHDGLSTTIPLDPEQLKKMTGFKVDSRRMRVASIPLQKDVEPPAYSAAAPPPQPATGSQLSAYTAAAQPPQSQPQEPPK